MPDDRVDTTSAGQPEDAGEETGETLVRFSGVDLGYRRRTVLRAVDLEIQAGQFWALFGANGRGKSTLLKAILGLHRPMQGELWRHPSLTDGHGLAYVPQRLDLNPIIPSTVQEFVSLGMVNLKLSRADRSARLGDALREVKLEHLHSRNIQELSGGERQRAMVARALVRRPRLLLLDEPTTGLDMVMEEALVALLQRLHQSGITLGLVTHDLVFAQQLASHACLFFSGQVSCGPAAALLQEGEVDDMFLSSATVTAHGLQRVLKKEADS